METASGPFRLDPVNLHTVLGGLRKHCTAIQRRRLLSKPRCPLRPDSSKLPSGHLFPPNRWEKAQTTPNSRSFSAPESAPGRWAMGPAQLGTPPPPLQVLTAHSKGPGTSALRAPTPAHPGFRCPAGGNDDKDEKQPPEWTLSMCSAPCLGSLYTPSIASSRLEEVSPTLFPGDAAGAGPTCESRVQEKAHPGRGQRGGSRAVSRSEAGQAPTSFHRSPNRPPLTTISRDESPSGSILHHHRPRPASFSPRPSANPRNQLLALDATPSKDDPCSGRHRCSIGPAPSHQQIYRWLPWSRASTCVQEAGHTMQATAAFALKILV
ncbi:hypothetical protein MJT46_003583 [Ovis ammon polii x Ovis aries]|nr:hypothetical protein MJT46_003583 [Ovis ammon polii x Ovis aries]